MRTVLLLLAVTALSGCERYVYQEPPGVHSRDTMQRNLEECEGHARRLAEGIDPGYWRRPVDKEQAIRAERDECMAARGWRRKQ